MNDFVSMLGMSPAIEMAPARKTFDFPLLSVDIETDGISWLKVRLLQTTAITMAEAQQEIAERQNRRKKEGEYMVPPASWMQKMRRVGVDKN